MINTSTSMIRKSFPNLTSRAKIQKASRVLHLFRLLSSIVSSLFVLSSNHFTRFLKSSDLFTILSLTIFSRLNFCLSFSFITVLDPCQVVALLLVRYFPSSLLSPMLVYLFSSSFLSLYFLSVVARIYLYVSCCLSNYSTEE